MKNQEIAELFDEIADALELKGEQKFRVLAYRSAARAIQGLAEDVAELAAQGKLTEIPGIGAGTAKKIVEYLETGGMAKHREALQGLSAELLELLKVPGLGPKTLALAHERLKVNNLADLRRVLEDGSLAALPGMGPKRAENLKKGIALREQVGARLPLSLASEAAATVVKYLRSFPGISAAIPAGSLRRGKETIGDIDILVTGSDPAAIIRHFTSFPGTSRVQSAGDTKASIVIPSGSHVLQVDLRVLPAATYGAALQYFTGSKEHNVKLRTIARQHGLKVSEYGVFRGRQRIAGRTEKEVYAALKMPVMPPEIREDRGEIEAALAGRLPHLIELTDLKGDLHAHTDLSDGTGSTAAMAEAAQRRGYKYLAITDHSRSAAYAGGLKLDQLRRSWDTIDKLNSRLKGIRLLKSAEVDILPDGRLDYPDRVLSQMDVVVASIHQGFKRNVTERICSALANPHVDIIAHPSGRLISRREGYDVNLEQVIECARRNNKVLELNAYPDRLDLSDVWLRRCKELGVAIAISTDAHAPADLDWIRYGIITARRGWLEPGDVVNCLGFPDLLAKFGTSQ